VDEEAWGEAFAEDLAFFADRAGGRALASVYFGGGTPSLMPASVISRVMEEAAQRFGIEPGAEITIEANPDDRSRFEELHALGFNRLSLGVQSFSDESLSFLGRNHSASQAQAAVDQAVHAFSAVSADMIYALPGKTPGAWQQELKEMISLGPQHLSLYQLTIEPGTPFGLAAKRGRLVPSADEVQAELYELTAAVTTAAGLPPYEVSNHARPGYEAVHNSLYWASADWLAIGPGAHGRLTYGGQRVATEGAARPKDYPAVPMADRISETILSEEEQLLETISSGLRPVRGLARNRLGEAKKAVIQAAHPLIEDGYLQLSDQYISASPRGRLVLDYLTARLTDAAF
jgi:oxygen-independent coproporphyrinogen-3 oxidase